MKKILFINIFAFFLGAISLSAQCSITTVISNETTETCAGSGDATALATGAGAAPITYLWSNGQTTALATGLTAGNYTVTATDDNGCTGTAQTTIVIDPEGVWIMNTATDALCYGSADGTAYVGVMTGVAPYTYLWDDPAGTTHAEPTNLAAGTYHVTVTDVNGCSNVAPVTVGEPSAIVITTNATAETCYGQLNGAITCTTSGGTGAKTYLWSNGSTDPNISNLSAGSYTLTVTDANGCIETTVVNVALTNPEIQLAESSVPVSCYGGNNGSATVSINAGIGPFSYLWSNGQTTATASAIAAGNHEVTVTGADGCSKTITVSVTEPSQMIATATANDITCYGMTDGTASISSSGGMGTATYSWSTGVTGANISNLAAGTYTATTTDANGCTTISSAVVAEPEELTATSSGTNVTTFGGNDGTATATATGGTPSHAYLWSNGGTTATISNLTAGTYTSTVTDGNGCTTSVFVEITQPNNPIVLTVSSTHATCGASDGSATVSAMGGTPPYTYLWDDGQTAATATNLAAGTYTVTVTDSVGETSSVAVVVGEVPSMTATASHSNETCVGSMDGHVAVSTSGGVGQNSFLWSTGDTTVQVNGLSVGTYTVTVTDALGCTAVDSATIELSPEGIWVDIYPTHVSCFGGNDGSAASVVTTGVPPYTYAWSNGGTTPTISNLTANTYTVSVTDVNGCVGVFTTEITQPTAIDTAGTTFSNPTVAGGNDGTIDLMVSGGTPPYTYSWTGPNGFTSTMEDLAGLAAGCYTVVITDDNDCTTTVEVCLVAPGSCMVTVTTTPESCVPGMDGTATATPSADCISPFSYQWEDSNMNTVGGNSATITGLAAGTYTVTITDGNGVTAVSSGTVQGSGMITSSATGVNLDCFGDMDGSVSAVGMNGTMPYTFAWEDSNMNSIGNSAMISGLGAGTYTVTVTDNNGCTSVSSYTITQPTAIDTAGTIFTNPTTPGGNDGTIDLTVTGGTQPYTYNWTGPNGFTSTMEDLTGLVAGCYTVVITDANSCTTTVEVCLVDPPSCTVTVTTTPESCVPGMDGTATATPSADCVAPFSYQWEDSNMNTVGGNSATITGLTAGTYTVTITDGNGLTAVSSGTVQGAGMITSSATGVNLDCFGDMDGSVSASGMNGTMPYTFAWEDSNMNSIGNSAMITGLGAGTYTVTVTDNNGCTSVSSYTITQPTAIDTAGTTFSNPTTPGGSDGTIDLNVIGGTPPYTFSWTGPNGFTSTMEDLTGLVAGCYTVVITDDNDCTTTVEVCLVDPPTLFMIVATSTNDPCTPTDNGTVSADTVLNAGGVPPIIYQWEDSNMNPIGNTQVITGLPAGTYTVYATDAIGQMDTQTVVVMTAPGLDLFVDNDTTICEEMITLNASTNITADSILWFEDMNGTTIQMGTTLLDYQLSPGANMVYVMAHLDSCIAIDSVEVMSQSVDVSVTPAMFLCVGEMTQLVATNNNAPQDIVTYDWTPSSAFIAGANTATPTLNPTVTGMDTVYLESMNQHGCMQLDTVVIQVQDSTNNFIQNQNCTSLQVDFNNTNGPDEYIWDFGDGSAPILAADPSHLYNTAGMYTVMMILPPGTPNTACLPDTVTKEIEVFADPIFSTDFLIDYDPCVEDSTMVVFSDITTLAQGSVMSWDWELPNGVTSTSPIDSVMITQTGTYSATLIVKAPDGCLDTLTKDFDINVFDITLQDTIIACEGTTDVPLNPFANPNYNYQWSGGLVGNNPAVTVGMSTNYTVTITDPNGAVICELEKEVVLIVPDPIDDLETSPDTILCEDGQVILNANSGIAMGYNWYDIYPNPGTNPIGTNDDLPLALNDMTPPQFYYVEAVDSFGCVTMDSVFAGQAQVVLPLINDLTLCLNNDTTITAFVNNNGDSTYYEWINNLGEVISLGDSATIITTAGGDALYTVNISNEHGCDALQDFNVSTIDISSVVNATGDPDTINFGETTTLRAFPQEGNYSYLWNNENTLLGDPTLSEVEAEPTSTTNYQVVVTDNSNGCSALANVLITVVDICDEPYVFLPNAFSPNDDGENDRLFLRSVVADEVYFIIYNRWGEKVFESNSINDGWDGRHNGEPVCSDVYGYYLRVKCISGKEYIKKGNVTVLK